LKRRSHRAPNNLLPPSGIPELEGLSRRLGLADYDLLLIGDGSGTVYDQPAGWACLAYDTMKQQVRLHTGALSCSTNNAAELLPYLQALWFFHQDHGQAPPSPARVQVVSDSELTVRCGLGRYARRANACYWAALAWFEGHGYRLSWRHVPRNSNTWLAWMDAAAGHARLLLAESPATLPPGMPWPGAVGASP
jgi:ribonuclease HI